MIDEHDGVIVDPEHHKVIFENDEVRVLDVRIAAGETTPLHSHKRRTVMYVVSSSHFVRRDENGNAMLDTRADPNFELPSVMYLDSTPLHLLENTDTKELHVISVELK